MLLFTLALTMLAISAAGRLPVEGIFHMSVSQSVERLWSLAVHGTSFGEIKKKAPSVVCNYDVL